MYKIVVGSTCLVCACTHVEYAGQSWKTITEEGLQLKLIKNDLLLALVLPGSMPASRTQTKAIWSIACAIEATKGCAFHEITNNKSANKNNQTIWRFECNFFILALDECGQTIWNWQEASKTSTRLTEHRLKPFAGFQCHVQWGQRLRHLRKNTQQQKKENMY